MLDPLAQAQTNKMLRYKAGETAPVWDFVMFAISFYFIAC